MAKHWRMLLVPGFSDCYWAECDVDRGRPVAIRNMLERANLHLEGYFRALYVLLGCSKIRMENDPSKSMKFYISIFSDKPPCMPIYFGIAVIILLEVVGAFSYFLAFAATSFSSFLASAARAFSSAFFSCLAFFFHFLFFLRLFLPLPLLS